MRWQMSLYNETSGKLEDAENPEKVVKRVQEVSAVLFHIELVRKLELTHMLYTPQSHIKTWWQPCQFLKISNQLRTYIVIHRR